MAAHIHRCPHEKIYTLGNECPSCARQTILPKPPKFSLDDKYANMRRQIKKKELQEQGLY